MTDDELLRAFESCSLPFEQWTHRAHVRVAWLYCCRHDLESATCQMRSGLKAYNKATNTPEKLERGYHETITQAFMRLVFAAARTSDPCGSTEEFCDRHPDLLSKLVLDRYYSKDRLMTMQAKSEFVSPDLAPLPVVLS